MSREVPSHSKRISRFDRIVLATVVGLSVLIGVLIWQGYSIVSNQAKEETAYRFLYLAPDDAGNVQLFAFSLQGAVSNQLTGEAGDVVEYAISPDGTLVAYTVLHQDGGSDLRIIRTDGRAHRLLLENCTQPAWSPGGDRLACTFQQLEEPPQLWWADPTSGQVVPLFENQQSAASAASWSYDGDWLAYVVPGGIRVTNLYDQRDLLFPTNLQEPVVWNESEDVMLMTTDQFLGPFPVIWILSADPASEQVTNLSGEELVEDRSPVWSHDGEWIVFGRKPANATMGRQIWVMRRDDSDARPLTDEPSVNHAIPIWSRDDRYLIYQRYTLTEPDVPPSIWLLDVETGAQEELVASGRQPAWLH